MPTAKLLNKGKSSEKGALLVILVFVLLAVGIVAAALVYKTFTNSAKKLEQTSEAVSVALKSEYSNPFEEDSQYVNPFDYQNPFDQIK